MTDRPKLAVFDCDGVLVDSERLSNVVFARLATRAGLPTTVEQSIERYMGRSTADCIADIEAALGRTLDFDLAEEYVRQTAEVLRRELVPVPGVTDLLDRLVAAGVALCVASSGTPEEIELRLRLAGLAGYFGERVYSALMVRRGKPAPDLFLLAAAEFGVDPADCVLVEDSPYGVRGGKAAGMTVIGYAALASAGLLADAGADVVVADMAEVAAVLAI